MTICRSVPCPVPWQVLTSVLGYLTLQTFQASLPLLFSERSPSIYYSEMLGACSWGLPDLTFLDYPSRAYTALSYSLILLSWVLPGLPVFCCGGYILGVLVQHRHTMARYSKKPAELHTDRATHLHTATGSTKDGTMGRASLTIVLFTLIYIVFNVPIWLYILVVLLSIDDHIAFLGSNLYVNIFLSRLSVVMNASVNPVMYILRCVEVRDDILGYRKGTKGRVLGSRKSRSRCKTKLKQQSLMLGMKVKRRQS